METSASFQIPRIMLLHTQGTNVHNHSQSGRLHYQVATEIINTRTSESNRMLRGGDIPSPPASGSFP